VDDRVDVSGMQGLQDRVGVADVRLDEREHVSGKVLDALLLDGAGIERVEVVYGRDAVTVVQEAAAEVPPINPVPLRQGSLRCCNERA
jgi:hypothetical protein